MTTLQVSRAPHEHAPAGRRCRQWLSVPPGKAVQRTRNPRVTLGSLEPDQGQNSSGSLGWDQAGSAGNKEEEGREVGSVSFAFQAPSSPQAPVPGNHSRSKLCSPAPAQVVNRVGLDPGMPRCPGSAVPQQGRALPAPARGDAAQRLPQSQPGAEAHPDLDPFQGDSQMEQPQDGGTGLGL